MHELVGNMHIYYTGVERSASAVLEKQHAAAGQSVHTDHDTVIESLLRIKDLGYRIMDAIKSENFDEYGKLLDMHWQSKKRMSSKISLNFVDDIYETAKTDYGVLGGKIIGAGGGGFLMLYTPGNHRRLSEFMARNGMRQLHYSVEYQGAKIVADLRASHEGTVNHEAESELCAHS
jgi:D-glycero-alpha-D-manno-heptose-7-phosphate kinase